MKIDIESIVNDQEIKEVLYALETAEQTVSKDAALAQIWQIRARYTNPDDDTVHALVYSAVVDYAHGRTDCNDAKHTILSLLDEFGLLRTTHRDS